MTPDGRVTEFTDVPGAISIELSYGSPRGLEQVNGESAEILALADSA